MRPSAFGLSMILFAIFMCRSLCKRASNKRGVAPTGSLSWSMDGSAFTILRMAFSFASPTSFQIEPSWECIWVCFSFPSKACAAASGGGATSGFVTFMYCFVLLRRAFQPDDLGDVFSSITFSSMAAAATAPARASRRSIGAIPSEDICYPGRIQHTAFRPSAGGSD